jgi:hypothetical protein
MKSYDFLTEGIVEDAHEMHQDHEVQMARKDCYQAAENAIALHKLLRHVSENQGIEGWVAAKITLASDYLDTVRGYLEYELMNQNNQPMGMASTPVSVEFPIAESRQIDESKMKDLDLDLKKPPVGMTDQAFKKKYNMTKAEANSKFSAKKEVEEGKELKQAKRKYNQAAKDANADQVGAGKKIDTMKKSLRQKELGKEQGMAEGKKRSDTYHIVNKDGKPANLASYNDRASAEKDRDVKHQGAEVRQLGPRGKVKGVTEMSAGSVATVVNPTPKNKAKVGTLFGGTYQREEANTPPKKRMFNKKA